MEDKNNCGSTDQAGRRVGIGIPLGMAIGIAVGVAIDNLALGVALGLLMGAGIGALCWLITSSVPVVRRSIAQPVRG